ncbi:MAG: hypothetical protein K0R57_6148 [Paenibacillaceae bacterium]|jgi:glutathione synthase/RimK-type ligase-like ATP-grasp enzyme|nr:hypothetical protein [Paenibacillaceae bacterium]
MTTLGIMSDTADEAEYEWLGKAASAAGFRDALLFTPEDVDWTSRRISGWVFDSSGCVFRSGLPFPPLLYDKGIYKDRSRIRNAVKVKRLSGITFIGEWLGNNKWSIQQQLMKNRQFRPHLIPSAPLANVAAVQSMLQKHKRLILKPVSTHEGAGIIMLYQTNGLIHLRENMKPGRQLPQGKLACAIQELKADGRQYLIQKWMPFQDRDGRPYDIRVLVQKNSKGRWQVTGMGIRQGEEGMLTSNLATGGRTLEVLPFLVSLFGAAKASLIEEQLRSLTPKLALHLERSTGKRLVELGLDFGIDRRGHVWLIEANTKPGKKVLEQLGPPEAYMDSLQLPVSFAGYLLRRSVP